MTSVDPIQARARRLLDRSPVWDKHACMPLRPQNERLQPQPERVKASGVDVVCLNVGVDPHSLEEHIRMLAAFRFWPTASLALPPEPREWGFGSRSTTDTASIDSEGDRT